MSNTKHYIRCNLEKQNLSQNTREKGLVITYLLWMLNLSLGAKKKKKKSNFSACKGFCFIQKKIKILKVDCTELESPLDPPEQQHTLIFLFKCFSPPPDSCTDMAKST